MLVKDAEVGAWHHGGRLPVRGCQVGKALLIQVRIAGQGASQGDGATVFSLSVMVKTSNLRKFIF